MMIISCSSVTFRVTVYMYINDAVKYEWNMYTLFRTEELDSDRGVSTVGLVGGQVSSE